VEEVERWASVSSRRGGGWRRQCRHVGSAWQRERGGVLRGGLPGLVLGWPRVGSVLGFFCSEAFSFVFLFFYFRI
jgi:hypothetical protein